MRIIHFIECFVLKSIDNSVAAIGNYSPVDTVCGLISALAGNFPMVPPLTVTSVNGGFSRYSFLLCSH